MPRPLHLDSAATGLAGARTALASPRRRPPPIWMALACAAAMAAAAVAVAAIVLLDGGQPGAGLQPASVRGRLAHS